jgi:hypothetical protein
VTSLEEVFNTLGKEENAKDNDAIIKANELNDSQDLLGSGLRIMPPSRSRSIGVILKNRLTVIRRKKHLMVGIVFPVAFMFGIFMLSIQIANFKV